MPEFSPSTPTQVRTFGGHEFKVPVLYTEGHVLTAPEANFLSSQLITVAGNRWSAKVSAAIKAYNEGKKEKDQIKTADQLGWDLQAEFDRMFAEYKVGVSNRGHGGGSKPSTDPVESLVNFLASADVKRRILKNGLKVRDFMQTKVTVDGVEMSKFAALVAQKIAQDGEALRSQAEAQLASAASEDDSLDLNVEQETVADAA